MTKWEEKKVSVFGLGKSGFAIIKKLKALGAEVFLTDSGKPDVESENALKELKVKYEFEKHSEESISNKDLIVLSPGVNPSLPILKKAKELNIPVISEIELAYRFLSKPIIAVTGTNGKTTTTTLIGEFLKAAGKKVAVAGNIGIPLVSIDDTDLDFIVAEISSYQLETIVTFRPWISLILNLTEDHLQRHKTMDNYGIVKSKIFENQKKTDFLIYNAEDPIVSKLVLKSEARLVPFYKHEAEKVLHIDSIDMKIKGEHNIENALAASLAAKIAGVKPETISDVLKNFPGVEHRIEFVRELNGIKFYNDSKGTNPDSTIVALKALGNKDKNIVLILGGRDKGTSLDKMVEKINETTKKVVLIGEATERFKEALETSGFKQTVIAKDFKSAVKDAYSSSKSGEIVLLSPACASFDMFKNFEDRGEIFKELVGQL